MIEESLARTSNGLNSAEVELQSPDWQDESIFIFMSTTSSTEKARTSLIRLDEVIVRMKTVFQVRNFKEAR
ncbi:hypothetical protein DPMN_055434 [Dreissena polymorpha]|uniref:Uncharacterized protein n=1 Tax=Dreissena polymorpha TaxID=45954 RepID=A0A9D4HU32_DREPO|nr:hypothetical protein DPMN_055434 [Dreissena polymorpha]